MQEQAEEEERLKRQDAIDGKYSLFSLLQWAWHPLKSL